MEKATLKHQLLLPIIALITVLFGCYGYLSYKIKSNQLWSELSKSIDRTENRLKKNLSGPIWVLDENASKSILISELQKESIDTIVILDKNGKDFLFGLSKDKKDNLIEVKDPKFLNSFKAKRRGKVRVPLNLRKNSKKPVYIAHYLISIDDSFVRNALANEIITIIFTMLVFNLCIGLIIYSFSIKKVIEPLKEISEISGRVSEGDFSKRISKKYTLGKKNEVISLSRSMNKMTDEIEKLTTNLKNEVQSQTKEIQLQNESFFNLLSNLDQGFLILNSRGDISGESTEITKIILGVDPKGQNVTDVFKLNFTEKKAFHKWLEHLFNSPIPFKDLVALGKKSLDHINDKEVSLIYRPIYGRRGKNKLEKLICILKDVTKEKQDHRKINLAHEKSDMVLKLIDSPIEFLDIISEIQALIDTFMQNTKTAKFEELFRSFHTLKARFANYKISIIVESIHDLETELFEIMSFKTNMEKEIGSKLFNGYLEENKEYLKLIEKVEIQVYRLGEKLKIFLKENRKIVEVAHSCVNSGDKIDELHEAKETVLKFNEIVTKKFILKNVRDSFLQYEKTISEISNKLDKSVDFILGETDINLRLDYYKDFLMSLHHVFRNSLDHGIEEKEERIAQNKKENGTIEVVFKKKSLFKFQIAIKDDGRGIDPLKVRNIAMKKSALSHLKLNNMTPNEIIQLIFEPGFSSKEEATAISGRGIGMDAVKSCVNELEGNVWVESDIGEGTLFVAELPIIK